MEWGRQKSDAVSVPAIQQTPETVMENSFGGGGYCHSIVAGIVNTIIVIEVVIKRFKLQKA